MTFNEIKNIVNDEVMMFKTGYDTVPFMTDIDSKDDQILGLIFKKLPLKKSSVGNRDVAIDKKRMYKFDIDEIPMVLDCLHRLYEKFHDADIQNWINDIEYHLKHYKMEDPL